MSSYKTNGWTMDRSDYDMILEAIFLDGVILGRRSCKHLRFCEHDVWDEYVECAHPNQYDPDYVMKGGETCPGYEP